MCSETTQFPLRFPHDFHNGLAVGLFEPEIPLNVGSIARTCAVTRTPLHLVGRVGFILDNRLAKRAGLDYWEHADVSIHKRWDDFESEIGTRRLLMFSTKGERSFWDIDYRIDDVLVFGSERSGLPDEILHSDRAERLTVPMAADFRSLNLSNCVAIVLYEALRSLCINT